MKISSLSFQVSNGTTTTACKNCHARIEPLISFITGPSKQINLLFDEIGANIDTDGYYYIPCVSKSSLPKIDIKINGVSYALTAMDYIYETGGKCMVLFYGSPADTWFLGFPFLIRYYSIYELDKNRIGFATSK